ncbi:MAG: hypothetical protein ACRC6V_09260 [Bacteroidales bacterium]
MNYYVRNKAGNFFKLDYPCFGMLSYLDQLQNSSWRNDIFILNEGDWDGMHEGASNWDNYSPLPGFEVDDLETLYLPTHGQDIDITHPFFQHLVKGELPEEIVSADRIRDNSCVIMNFQHLPCDELMMPLFAVREVLENSMCKSVHDLVKELNVPDSLAIFFGATFYKSTSYNFVEGQRRVESTFYPHQEDGGTFSNGKIGDFVAIINGAQPRYINSRWGDLDRGYPSYGVSELDPRDDDWDSGQLSYENNDPISNRAHHMNDSLMLQSLYEDDFLNKRLTDSELNRMSEQEFRSFVMEILQHVNYQNHAGA